MANDMKSRSLTGTLTLLLASFFWGSTFIIQSDAADKLPTFTYLSARSFVGAAALFAVIAVRALILKKKGKLPFVRDKAERKAKIRHVLISGAAVGTVLTVAACFQQQGIACGATAGEAGFLTALYMFVVPLLCFIFYRKKLTVNLLAGAVLMAAGLYMLCIFDKGWSAFGTGPAFIILSAVCYAGHIMTIDRFKDVDGMTLSALQFTVVAVISGILALIFDRGKFTGADFAAAQFPILYAGLASSAIGFTLQIYGQQYAPPTLATIVMSLESVIALLCEWACGQIGIFGINADAVRLTPAKIVGCVLAFAGIIVAQLSFGGVRRFLHHRPPATVDGAPEEDRRDPPPDAPY